MRKFLYIFIVFALPSCSSPKQDAKPLDIAFEDFEASFEKPFTNELKHYKFALDWWSSPYYNKGALHFPDTLYNTLEYEFVFIPQIMQGQSSVALKIGFASEELAEDFYIKETKGNIQQEFKSFTQFQGSDFCFPDGFGFPSRYKLNDSYEIKLFQAPKCIGKRGDVIGGIASGIAIDRSTNSVICWASDMRL